MTARRGRRAPGRVGPGWAHRARASRRSLAARRVPARRVSVRRVAEGGGKDGCAGRAQAERARSARSVLLAGGERDRAPCGWRDVRVCLERGPPGVLRCPPPVSSGVLRCPPPVYSGVFRSHLMRSSPAARAGSARGGWRGLTGLMGRGDWRDAGASTRVPRPPVGAQRASEGGRRVDCEPQV